MSEKRATRSDKIILTEKDRDQLETMSAMGLTIAQIAAILGFSKETLKKRLQEDYTLADLLESGRGKANLTVARSLFGMATDKNKPNVTAAIFYLKCRAGWIEPDHINEDEQPETYTRPLTLVASAK